MGWFYLSESSLVICTIFAKFLRGHVIVVFLDHVLTCNTGPRATLRQLGLLCVAQDEGIFASLDNAGPLINSHLLHNIIVNKYIPRFTMRSYD